MEGLELDNSKLKTCALKLDNSTFTALELDSFICNVLELGNYRFRNFDDSKIDNKN